MEKRNTTMDIKPEILYQMKNSDDEIRIGDIVPAFVKFYDDVTKSVYVKITRNTNGFIRLNNLTYTSRDSGKDNNSSNEIPEEVKMILRKKVIGRVVAIYDNGSIELDRRQIIKATTKTLANNVGSIVNATVVGMVPYGIFVDIGNGVRSFVHVTECSRLRYSPIHEFFKSEQEIPKLKILSFDTETNRFELSIKQAYERKELKTQELELVRVAGNVKDGRLVEIDPATVGIMDIYSCSMDLKKGSYALAYIKKITEKGFHSAFVDICDNPKNFQKN